LHIEKSERVIYLIYSHVQLLELDLRGGFITARLLESIHVCIL